MDLDIEMGDALEGAHEAPLADFPAADDILVSPALFAAASPPPLTLDNLSNPTSQRSRARWSTMNPRTTMRPLP